MKKALLASIALLLIVGVFALPVVADNTLARFKGGIGVIPLPTSAVRGVQPAGQIWVIGKLDAKVKSNGEITVHGKGLVLGGGNNAGRAGGQSVFATLICEAAPGPFTERNTNLAGVPLALNGDFSIDDVLAPAPPNPCASPMLLIRNASGLNWFAAGILKSDDNDD